MRIMPEEKSAIHNREVSQARRWDSSHAETYGRWRSCRRTKFFDQLYLDSLAGSSVLEVGCGAGHLLAKLRAKHASASFTGIDISPVMVERCRTSGFSQVFVGSGNAIPTGDAQFDVVVAGVWVMKYLDADLAIKEMYRVLKPGGKLAFDLPFLLGHGKDTFRGLLRHSPKIWRVYIGDSYLSLDGRWPWAWTRRLEAAGFRVLDVVGGIEAPLFSSRFGFRHRHRSALALLLSSIIWFLAEKPAA